MKILGRRVLVSKIEEEVKEGFQAVEVQDNFVYKGKVEQIGVYDGATRRVVELIDHVTVGNTILFAKYSPDTHDIEVDGKKFKVVSIDDILAVL